MTLRHQIRKLAQQLVATQQSPGMKLIQGEVVQEDEDGSLIIRCQGSTVDVPGWRYLLDGYVPNSGDIVWIIDGGPGSKIVLGPTVRP